MGRILTEGILASLPTLDARNQALAARYLGNARRMLAFFEQSLAGQEYFAGEAFTAADIMMLLPARVAQGACPGEATPNLAAWSERVTARPAYARMLARALPNGVPPTYQGWPKEEAAPS